MIEKLIKKLIMFLLFVFFVLDVSASSFMKESDFFNKLDGSNMKSIKNIASSGNYTKAKDELLNYYKNKFSKTTTYYYSGNSSSFNYLRLFNAYAFQEYYLGHVSVNNDSNYSWYSININKNVSGNYVLTSLKASTDYLSIVSKDISNSDKPQLIITKNDGKSKIFTPSKDSYIRAGNHGNRNFGNENMMYVHHAPNGSVPYSSDTMRSYLAFNIDSAWKSNIKSVVLKVKTKIVRTKSGVKTDTNIPLVVMQGYYTNWTESNLTWNKVVNENGIGHYSYDGIKGGFDWVKPTGTPSEFLNYNIRFSDLASLCQEADKLMKNGKTSDAKSYYNRAKNLLLDFINDAEDSSITHRALDPSYRMTEFPAIYKTLLTNNILTSEENYLILCWVYKETDHIYQDKSNTMFKGASATPLLNEWKTDYVAYSNWGISHLTGFYNSIAYFKEFKDNSSWKKVFTDRFNLILDTVIKSDGSYRDVSFGYPINTIKELLHTIKIMDVVKDNALSTKLKSKVIGLGRYLMYSSYPNGVLPFWGEGWESTKIESYLKLIKNTINKNSVSGTDLSRLNEIISYLDGKLTPQMIKFTSNNVVTDKTGYTNKDSGIFINAKTGGSHGHHDALSLLFYYNGRELLRDTGESSYDKNHPHYKFQHDYTSSHNTIEINGKAQNWPGALTTSGSSIDIKGNNGLSTITSSTNATSGFTHYRNITYAKELGSILIVSDYVKPNNSNVNTYTQNWHTEPGSNSIINGTTGKTNYNSGSNLIIVQANTINLSANIKNGYDSSQLVGQTKYFEYTKKTSGNIFYQTVLYPTSNNTSNINVQAKSITSTDKESSIRISLTDKNNPNKLIYSYTLFANQGSNTINDKEKNKVFVTDAKHMVVSYDTNSKIHVAYLIDGSSLKENNNIIIQSKSKITDLTIVVNNDTLLIYSSDNNVINGRMEVSFNIGNQNIKTIKINGNTLSSNKYINKDGKITINKSDGTKKGDVNSDGKVTSTDYIMVRKHILKQTTLKGEIFKKADVTGDGKVTSLDYIAIRKIILKN